MGVGDKFLFKEVYLEEIEKYRVERRVNLGNIIEIGLHDTIDKFYKKYF
jgi:hypothetical protein